MESARGEFLWGFSLGGNGDIVRVGQGKSPMQAAAVAQADAVCGP
jgi:hypothetical protein